MIMKILLHVKKNLSKERCRQTSLVCSKYIFGVVWCHPRNILLFLLLFKFGSSIPSTLTKKMLFKHEHFFFLKTGNLILYRVPISPANIPCLRLSSQSDKYEIKEASIIQISKLFSELVTIWDYRLLFFELGKIEKSSQSNIQKCPKISL